MADSRFLVKHQSCTKLASGSSRSFSTCIFVKENNHPAQPLIYHSVNNTSNTFLTVLTALVSRNVVKRKFTFPICSK